MIILNKTSLKGISSNEYNILNEINKNHPDVATRI